MKKNKSRILSFILAMLMTLSPLMSAMPVAAQEGFTGNDEYSLTYLENEIVLDVDETLKDNDIRSVIEVKHKDTGQIVEDYELDLPKTPKSEGVYELQFNVKVNEANVFPGKLQLRIGDVLESVESTGIIKPFGGGASLEVCFSVGMKKVVNGSSSLSMNYNNVKDFNFGLQFYVPSEIYEFTNEVIVVEDTLDNRFDIKGVSVYNKYGEEIPSLVPVVDGQKVSLELNEDNIDVWGDMQLEIRILTAISGGGSQYENNSVEISNSFDITAADGELNFESNDVNVKVNKKVEVDPPEEPAVHPVKSISKGLVRNDGVINSSYLYLDNETIMDWHYSIKVELQGFQDRHEDDNAVLVIRDSLPSGLDANPEDVEVLIDGDLAPGYENINIYKSGSSLYIELPVDYLLNYGLENKIVEVKVYPSIKDVGNIMRESAYSPGYNYAYAKVEDEYGSTMDSDKSASISISIRGPVNSVNKRTEEAP